MFQRKTRRFRRRPNDRGRMPHVGGGTQARMRTNSFSNIQPRNNFRQSLSVEKLFEKYNSLAKEAMTSGDKTLAENYLQHADHFLRVIEDKNNYLNQNKIKNDDRSVEQVNTNLEQITKNKE